jgi:hypothetical protein
MNVNDVRSAAAQTQTLRQAQQRATIQFHELVNEHSPDSINTETKELPAALTDSERQYFEQVFPDATEDVRSYNPYQRDGVNVPVRLGSLLDRKG